MLSSLVPTREAEALAKLYSMYSLLVRSSGNFAPSSTSLRGIPLISLTHSSCISWQIGEEICNQKENKAKIEYNTATMLHIRPVEEKNASEKVAAVYSDIKKILNIHFVPVLFQYIAGYEEWFLYVWEKIKTNY